MDWLLVLALLMFMIGSAFTTRKYQTSVADFLVANRCAGRYLLGVSEGIASVGVVTVIGIFEIYYEAGFSLIWWAAVYNLALLGIAMSGWVVYRYRQTRAMTLAQLLEMRYSRRFRIFAGILIFISGTLNFGIFPAIGARFFQHFCGIGSWNVRIAGVLEIDLIYALILVILIGLALFFTFMSGQISVMLISFIQGTIFNFVLCLVVIYLIYQVSWADVVSILLERPKGQSMLDPFNAGQTKNFNVWFYVIQTFGAFYCVRAWQGNQGYFGAALNPHEARMGNILGLWRTLTQQFMMFIIPVFAYVFLRHASFTEAANSVNAHLSALSDPVLQTQLTTTVTLSNLLPVGLIGAFAAAMLAAQVSTDDTYMHSWGSVFIQDVVIPLRKKHFRAEEHVKYLKYSICGVGVFAFLFSLLFPQNDYVMMYLAMTGTIWLGGAGAVIIGGLYWKKGSTLGAYGALITGILFAIISFALPRMWSHYGKEFPLNSQELWFISMLASSVVYIVLSLINNEIYDLDKLLHRGKYQVKEISPAEENKTDKLKLWQRFVGVTTDFTAVDKAIYFGIFGYIVLMCLILLLGSIWHFLFGIEESVWKIVWYVYVWTTVLLCIVTVLWYAVGG